jgi:hypothetical protein
LLYQRISLPVILSWDVLYLELLELVSQLLRAVTEFAEAWVFRLPLSSKWPDEEL